MVVFEGLLNEICLSFIQRKQKLSAIIKFVVIFLLISLPIIFLALLINLYLLFGLGLTLIIALVDVVLDKSFSAVPTKITINDDYIEASNDKYKLTLNLDNVKLVIDMGSWYNFQFKYKINNMFYRIKVTISLNLVSVKNL